MWLPECAGHGEVGVAEDLGQGEITEVIQDSRQGPRKARPETVLQEVGSQGFLFLKERKC